MTIIFEGTPTTSWIEAIGAAIAALLAILSLVMSIRTDRKTNVSHRLIRLETQLQSLVAGIADVDKRHLSSPTATDNQRAEIVAAKTQEYEALYTVYKNAFPESDRHKFDRAVASIKTLEDRALAAAGGHNQQALNQATAAYVTAIANFVNSLKSDSEKRLAEVSRHFDE